MKKSTTLRTLVVGLLLAVGTTSSANADLSPEQDTDARAHLQSVAAFVDGWRARHDYKFPDPALVERRMDTDVYGGDGGWGYVRVERVGYCVFSFDNSPQEKVNPADLRWYDSDTNTVSTPTALEMQGESSSREACPTWARRGFPNPYEARKSLISDVKIAAIAMETYLTDHPTATSAPTLKVLRRYGFNITEHNTVTVRGGQTTDGYFAYCVRATSTRAGFKKDQALWYDSNMGGLQRSFDLSTSSRSTCARFF